MAKRVNKLLIFLIVFIIGIVGGVALVIVFSQPTPNVNSVAFGYLNEDQEYKRFFYKEIYMTGNPEYDNLYIKVFVNNSVELSTTDIQTNFNNAAVSNILSIVKQDNGYVVTPKAEGDVTLYVRSIENTSATDKCVISVRQNRLSEMKVTKLNEHVLDTPSNDKIYDIYKISDERDNAKYNRVYLDIGNGNASSLEILEYDQTKIDDIFVDAATFSLQIKVKDEVESGATTLVKLGWKEHDSRGNAYILGQSGLVFRINDYGVEEMGLMLYTVPNFDGNGKRLEGTGGVYNINLGKDVYGNKYSIVYVKPYAIYSSGFEDYDIQTTVSDTDRTLLILLSENEMYYRVDIGEETSDVYITFTYQQEGEGGIILATVSASLAVRYKNGTFNSYL